MEFISLNYFCILLDLKHFSFIFGIRCGKNISQIIETDKFSYEKSFDWNRRR